MLDALLAGALAGAAIAIPVGPITILIFEMAMRRGFRVAAAAAAGAGSADGAYATLAAVAGAAIAGLIAPVAAPARLVGAALLGAIGLRGLFEAWQSGRQTTNAPAAGRASGPLRTYVLVLGLTIANPMTFLYFAALMIGLPVTGGGVAEKLVFAIGAFSASLAWQLFLAASGSLLHGRLPPRARLATRIGGSLIILAFAVRIALEAFA